MKYYIIAGEASGDLHGSNLIKALKQQDAQADIRCWGGDMMQAAGARLVKHYRELAFMGFIEVVKNLRTILRNLTFCKKDITGFKPDAIILIDYPGFNLRIAQWGKANGFKIIYYISPQVWAWKENRVHTIKQCVDKMLVILPFEKDFYKKWNYEVQYVGHPLVEVVDEWQAQHPNTVKTNIIALLPGSRRQEILKKLPVMLEVSRYFTDHEFVVAMAPGLDKEFYNNMLSGYSNVKAVSGKTYDLLMQATAALVTSGTATLETALFAVPEVVCYKGSAVSYEIAKRVIKIKYISLVNLIMDKPVVKELIQHELTVSNVKKELQEVLGNQQRIQQLQEDYSALKTLLSQGGHASTNAAKAISNFLQSG
ncbi:lipid-A-disaccharide synthase [Agriterribacter sp.]|uniref:lipid-A-disaccharide synthase n=1 Tax=Agriterribacter sp. TaxID=2821509 RepID=UPI002CB394AD|nr:lipid-A-disaccharide synthase [Agriterribacter sp.]HRO47470.1 lipid-A-disaccharide synthase [Agriterribacter sp.]HRQ19479.1 lipid-A-disaccharide synthase [Agriterribacter sp.]